MTEWEKGNNERVYLAGKITGDGDYVSKFERAKEKLQREGFIVLNPAVLPSGMSNSDYMRICLAMIDVADKVAFLPDFLDSPRALVEFTYSTYIKKPYIFLEEGRQ